MAGGSGLSSNSYQNSRRPTLGVIHRQSVKKQTQSVQRPSISSSSASTRPTVPEVFQHVPLLTSTRPPTVTELSGGSSPSISSIWNGSVPAIIHDSSKATLQRPSLSSRLSLRSSSTTTSTTAVSQIYSIGGPQHHEVFSQGSISNPYFTPSQQNSERDRTQHMTSISKNQGAGPQYQEIPSLQKAQGRRKNKGATRNKKLQNIKEVAKADFI